LKTIQDEYSSSICDDSDAFFEFEDSITELTKSQRCHDWFISRFFRLTGSVIGKILKSIGHHAVQNLNTNINSELRWIMDTLKISHAFNPMIIEQGVRRANAVIHEEELNYNCLIKKTKLTLIRYCEEKNISIPLSVTTKKPLCELILQATLDNRQLTTTQRSSLYHDMHWFTPSNDTPNDTTFDDDNLSSENEVLSGNESFFVEKALMQAWFMHPVKNTAMKVGSANEKNVLAYLSQFVECHSQHESSRSGGLVRESPLDSWEVTTSFMLDHN
jgi:hypothetical protein